MHATIKSFKPLAVKDKVMRTHEQVVELLGGLGGESGHGARPIEESWILSIMEQCTEANVPFFFKQWGGVRKSRAGRLLQGRTYDEFPAIQSHPMPDRAQRESRMAHLLEVFSDLILPVTHENVLPSLQ